MDNDKDVKTVFALESALKVAAWIMCFCLLALSVAQPAAAQGRPDSLLSFPDMQWRQVADGVAIGSAQLDEPHGSSEASFVVVRIAPAKVAFTLSMASQEGARHSLAGWAKKQGLLAGINASMYLPDKLTSTGYMRSAEHINNPKIGGRLGAFFVADPTDISLPAAMIVEKGDPTLPRLLQSYRIVIQNFRLLDQESRLLWAPGGAMTSIAAVGVDVYNNVLFILSQPALTVERFTMYLKHFVPHVRSVMYVEGGGPAGLVLRESFADKKPVYRIFMGKKRILRTQGDPAAHIPNVLGIVPKAPVPWKNQGH